MLSITDPPVTAHRGQRAKYPPTPDTWHGQINPQADIRLMLEMTEQTREAVDSYIGAASKKPGEFPFSGRRGQDRPITTRQSARLVCNGLPVLGWTRAFLARTHLRRTKATLIYRRTGSLIVGGGLWLMCARSIAALGEISQRWSGTTRYT